MLVPYQKLKLQISLTGLSHVKRTGIYEEAWFKEGLYLNNQLERKKERKKQPTHAIDQIIVQVAPCFATI